MEDNSKITLYSGLVCMGLCLISLVIAIFLLSNELDDSLIIAGVFSLIFGYIGVRILLIYRKEHTKFMNIINKGNKYTGKIYGYQKTGADSTYYNIKVRYFDENGIENEAILETHISRDNKEFPAGAIIDIMRYGNDYLFDRKSVRYTTIDREDELLDDNLFDPNKSNVISLICPSCGHAINVNLLGLLNMTSWFN